MKKGTVAGLIGLAAAGAGITGSLIAIGNVLYSKSVGATPTDWNKTDSQPLWQEGRQWARDAVDFRSVTIPAADDLILWAAMVLPKADSHHWAICMHGYRDCHESMGAIGKHYAEQGWNVLLPDQRGHGNSQGNYVGWSYDERLDVVAWINYIIRRDPEAEIVLHGVSMGAATVLMTTGGPLQNNVKAAVADCGFTSAEEEMKFVLDRLSRKSLGIPPALPFSLMFSALRKITLRRAGYDLRDAAPIEAVSRSRIPTLFIHGVNDGIVPPSMMGKLYEAARCPKRFLWVPNADHAESLPVAPELYWDTVHDFLKQYMD